MENSVLALHPNSLRHQHSVLLHEVVDLFLEMDVVGLELGGFVEVDGFVSGMGFGVGECAGGLVVGGGGVMGFEGEDEGEEGLFDVDEGEGVLAVRGEAGGGGAGVLDFCGEEVDEFGVADLGLVDADG